MERKHVYNVATNFFLPELSALAKIIAATIPDGHWFRSAGAGRALGVLAAKVKNFSHSASSDAEYVLFQRASSLIRCISRELRHPVRNASSGKKINDPWVASVLREVDERVAGAKDPVRELAKISKDFGFMDKFKETFKGE